MRAPRLLAYLKDKEKQNKLGDTKSPKSRTKSHEAKDHLSAVSLDKLAGQKRNTTASEVETHHK